MYLGEWIRAYSAGGVSFRTSGGRVRVGHAQAHHASPPSATATFTRSAFTRIDVICTSSTDDSCPLSSFKCPDSSLLSWSAVIGALSCTSIGVNRPQPGVVVAYHRDRGEDPIDPRVDASVADFFDSDIEQYGYLFTDEGEWLVKGDGDPVPLPYVLSGTVFIN